MKTKNGPISSIDRVDFSCIRKSAAIDSKHVRKNKVIDNDISEFLKTK
jgi:hypothetical protein